MAGQGTQPAIDFSGPILLTTSSAWSQVLQSPHLPSNCLSRSSYTFPFGFYGVFTVPNKHGTNMYSVGGTPTTPTPECTGVCSSIFQRQSTHTCSRDCRAPKMSPSRHTELSALQTLHGLHHGVNARRSPTSCYCTQHFQDLLLHPS